jgi:hypothetical protein
MVPIMLQPDVRAYFPDSDAVNKALRSLINLLSQIPDKSKSKTKSTSSKRLATPKAVKA